jgi:hypothetical protein
MQAGLVITAVAVVLLGLFPGSVVEWAAGPTAGSAVSVTAAIK